MCTDISRVHETRSQAGSRREETHRELHTLGIIGLFALGLLAVPRAVEAQKPVKVPRIGVLSFYVPPASPDWHQQWPFWQRMHELGWREGHNIIVEYRWAEERYDCLPSPRNWTSLR